MIEGSRFHHVGYAVSDIRDTAKTYIEEGWVLSEVIDDSIQNTRIAFLSKPGMPLLELVSPIDAHSPVNTTLAKSGVSTYHICYEVDDIKEATARMRKRKFIQLFKPVPAVALGGRLITYLFHKDVGLIELVQSEIQD